MEDEDSVLYEIAGRMNNLERQLCDTMVHYYRENEKIVDMQTRILDHVDRFYPGRIIFDCTVGLWVVN